MKTAFLLILVLLFPFASKEQTYTPFPDSSALWQEVLLPYPPGPMPAYLEHIHYTVSGDTLINSTLYKKLFKTDYNPLCFQNFTGPYFFGGIRNDSNERKVYYYDVSTSEEWLLYDFTLNVGDTVPPTYNNVSYPELYVESIDSVLIGSDFRKRFIYSQETYQPIQVIEGIGAESGLLGYMVFFESINYLRCFHQNDSLLWINPRADSCNLETDTCLAISVPERIPDNRLMLIYPNPASDHIYLHLYPEILRPSADIRIEIYNSFGEKLAENQVPKWQYMFSFNVTGLSNGLYIIVLKINQRTLSTKKFLIVH